MLVHAASVSAVGVSVGSGRVRHTTASIVLSALSRSSDPSSQSFYVDAVERGRLRARRAPCRGPLPVRVGTAGSALIRPGGGTGTETHPIPSVLPSEPGVRQRGTEPRHPSYRVRLRDRIRRRIAGAEPPPTRQVLLAVKSSRDDLRRSEQAMDSIPSSRPTTRSRPGTWPTRTSSRSLNISPASKMSPRSVILVCQRWLVSHTLTISGTSHSRSRTDYSHQGLISLGIGCGC